MPGEYAEMMLDGTCCTICGEFVGSDAGYPIACRACAPEQPLQKHHRQPPRDPNSNRSKKRAAKEFQRAVAERRAKGLL